MNHGFVDANKRTAVVLVHTLISKSGYRLVAAQSDEQLQDALERVILATATSELKFPDLARWFEARLVRQPN